MPYTALPGKRFAYDQDGTIVQLKDRAGSWTTVDSGSVGVMNDEDDDSYAPFFMQNPNDVYFLSFLFPELRNLIACWCHVSNPANGGVFIQVSTDTTDGKNGVWTEIANVGTSLATQPYWRSSLSTFTQQSNIKGVRLRLVSDTTSDYTNNIYQFHMYGAKVSHQGLAFWDPTLDQAIAITALDFQDIAQGAVQSKTFRIKNLHATQTAQSITVAQANPSGTMAVEFSIDGGAYASSLSIGNLAASAITNVITVRRTVPGGEAIASNAERISAVPASWA